MFKSILLFIFIFASLVVSAQSVNGFIEKKEATYWVDSVYNSMSNDQRIAQLFWIEIVNPGNKTIQEQNEKLIKNYQPGGMIFFKSQSHQVIQLSNHYQELSKVPMLVAIDGEWGLGMRIQDAISFPYQMTLGAVQNDSLIYQMGFEIGQQLEQMGIHVNLAPVADVNNNPENPVIGKRSFGEVPMNVAHKSMSYAQGLQDAGIIAVAKHFPGHGDTNKDSHLTLPLVDQTRERLDTMELIPFQFMIDHGIKGVMTAHLAIPSLEEKERLPSGLSKAIVTGLLKNEMGFDGLVITDAMNMKGVSNYISNDSNELLALLAGNDVVEYSPDLIKAIESVREALSSGKMTQQELENKCKKVLSAKYWCGLNHYKPIANNFEISSINTPEAEFLKRQLYRSAITVIKNEVNLPFAQLNDLNLKVIAFEHQEEWRALFRRYMEVEVTDGKKVDVSNEMKVLVLPDEKSYFAHKETVKSILDSGNCILVYLGNPYKLTEIPKFDQASSIILTYENKTITRDWITQLLFGAIPANGRLPVSINSKYRAGVGINLSSLGRLKYTMPEELNLDSKYIKEKVDSVVKAGLSMKAFPGCRILVAKEGKVIFNECYGYHTYDSLVQVGEHDVYDLASVTKITGPLPLIMKGVEENKIDLDHPFSEYWPDWQSKVFHGSNKENLTFRDVLAHQARLQAYINYYPMTMRDGHYKRRFYKDIKTDRYAIEIEDSLYLKTDFKRKIYKSIRKSPLQDEKSYKYSGLSFMVYPAMLTELYEQEYTELLYNTFYKPLGASSLGYNPVHYIDTLRLVPTEIDNKYRFGLIKGRVHDEAAAVMGGVSGNAGLFSSAHDLAKVMQMYLQKGEYGGQRYLSEQVMNEFIRVQFPDNDNRRGLGFDKPLFGNDTLNIENSYPAPAVSPSSFGHSGFTGTFVWMDPEYDLLYIFLSNRVYPSRENRLIYQRNIRPSIQQVFYDAIKMTP